MQLSVIQETGNDHSVDLHNDGKMKLSNDLSQYSYIIFNNIMFR